MDPALVVRTLVDAINDCNWVAIGQVLTPGFRRHSLASGAKGLQSVAEIIEFLKAERSAYPDATEAVLLSFAHDDMVAARHEFRGTQRGWLGAYLPMNRKVCSCYIALYRIEGDRIAESWAEWDNLADLRQLGHL